MDRIVYYDLETTGLRPLYGSNGVEILSIGACYKDPDTKSVRTFQNFMYPRHVEISQEAFNIHGLDYEELGERGAIQPRTGIQQFLYWITENPDSYQDIVLVWLRSYFLIGNEFIFILS